MALVARHQNKESKAIKVIVAGAAGRMGARLISLIDESKTFQLTGAVERIGQDVGELAGCARLGISLSDDVTAIAGAADVLIDFTAPEAALANLHAMAL